MNKDGSFFIFDKTERIPLSVHFASNEFVCKCSFESCKEQRISIELINRLENIRTAIDMPLSITSGFRCHEHQLELAASGLETATGISSHELGNAVDMKSKDMSLLEKEADKAFQDAAMGTANSFIHVDMRNDRKRRWTYKKI